jgi:acylphosphatase
MRLARRYLISGRVQRVGFRFFAQAAALREGLNGWVANTADGRVEIEAEGEVEALGRFDRHISHGPPGADVERIDRFEQPAGGADTGFHIR